MPSLQHLTLPNGLRVVLCHAPRLKRSAASLRVAAGSHDVPLAWPGLAHFLEHLFFLGTERFAGDDTLMSFVQRHGGQLNASTRERSTDYFFELPVPVFAQGLERLCEMLAAPRLNKAQQLREREVLHAEFIAWSRDAAVRQQVHLLTKLNAAHPLRGFHAGNRYSLPVHRATFQQALQDFYQRFYQAGQLTLCLSGPQPLDELRALATQHGGYFAPGSHVAQTPPPRLLDSGVNLDAHLLFAAEHVPEAAHEAAAFFCHCLGSTQPGGLAAELRARGLLEALKPEVLYQFAGQLLIHVQTTPAPTPRQQPQINQLLFDWLRFFKAHWPQLREDYNRFQQRQLQVGGALALAHHYCRELPGGLSDQGGQALSALLAQICPATAEPYPAEVDWRLPAANPFLQGSVSKKTVYQQPMLTYSDALPSDSAEAAVYLRWQLPAPQPALWKMLDHSLQALAAQAAQAGVHLTFSAYGDYWQLRLTGLASPMPAVLEHTLKRLSAADDAAWARYGQADTTPPPIPIRQLLTCLPDHLLSRSQGAESQALQRVWARTCWQGFAVGLSDDQQQLLNAQAGEIPGCNDAQPLRISCPTSGKHRQTEATPSPESAVLLFCALPGTDVADEAAWRLLAHLVQGPFYQRLRVELQLGYAVFSGWRQFAGQSGLLFGVQSPKASVAQLVAHLQGFIDGLEELIHSADLRVEIATLLAQLDVHAMDSAQAGELLWQAHLAGHGPTYLPVLRQALLKLDRHAVQQALARLQQAAGGWLLLSNDASGEPIAGW